jgi:hypothetical protein
MMLLRKDGLDLIAIPQPGHARVGQRALRAPMPYDEVCLAAGQHDIGSRLLRTPSSITGC